MRREQKLFLTIKNQPNTNNALGFDQHHQYGSTVQNRQMKYQLKPELNIYSFLGASSNRTPHPLAALRTSTPHPLAAQERAPSSPQ